MNGNANGEIEIVLDSGGEEDSHTMEVELEATEMTLQLGAGDIGIGLSELDNLWCMVMSLVPNQQAAIAGFQEGDVIVSIGGTRVPEGCTRLRLPRPCWNTHRGHAV